MTVETLKDRRAALRAGEPHCPYCLTAIEQWPENSSFNMCSHCRRPLWLFPVATKTGYKQILCVIDAGRTYIAIGAIIFFLGLFLFGYFDGAAAWFALLILFPFGIFDLIDAHAGFTSNSQRLPGGLLFYDKQASAITAFKALWGILTLLIAAALFVSAI